VSGRRRVVFGSGIGKRFGGGELRSGERNGMNFIVCGSFDG